MYVVLYNLGKVQNHKLDTLAQTELNYTTIKYEDLCGKGVNQKTFDLINPLEALTTQLKIQMSLLLFIKI